VAGWPVIRVPNPGKYHRLCTYLRGRLRRRIVLTFAEIEGLLGFPLPAAARLDSAW
jgi:hypothetical protein